MLNSGNSSISGTSAVYASSYSRKSPITSAAHVLLSASTTIGFAVRGSTRTFSVRIEHRVTRSSRRRGARIGSCAEYKYGLHDLAICVMLTEDTFKDFGKQRACDCCGEGASASAHSSVRGPIAGTGDSEVVGDRTQIFALVV